MCCQKKNYVYLHFESVTCSLLSALLGSKEGKTEKKKQQQSLIGGNLENGIVLRYQSPD
jgi:hypothetical protein